MRSPIALAATILTGVIQILFGVLRVHRLLRFVPRAVMIGFVNALAVLIFSAQLPHLQDANTATWAMLALGLALIYGLPRLPFRLFTVLPSTAPPLTGRRTTKVQTCARALIRCSRWKPSDR